MPLNPNHDDAGSDPGGGVVAILVAAYLLLLRVRRRRRRPGSGVQERRQDQSAADFAALAAVQFAKPTSGCGSSSACVSSARANGTNEAVAVASAGLDDPGCSRLVRRLQMREPARRVHRRHLDLQLCRLQRQRPASLGEDPHPTIDSPTFFGKCREPHRSRSQQRRSQARQSASLVRCCPSSYL